MEAGGWAVRVWFGVFVIGALLLCCGGEGGEEGGGGKG